ncbi:response regulator [Candidatus Chlorohelix sp.]|uniref:response regulator n=1 Tax=Candidatus Chlorohelix sp. TaxID=3139201 RepID=UPI00303D552F
MEFETEIVLSFLDEVSEYIPQLERHFKTLGNNPNDKESLEEAYRLAHSIKGSASMLEMEEMRQLGWELEQILLPFIEKKARYQPQLSQQMLSRVNNLTKLIDSKRQELSSEADVQAEEEWDAFDEMPTFSPIWETPTAPSLPLTNFPRTGQPKTLDDLILEFSQIQDTRKGDNLESLPNLSNIALGFGFNTEPPKSQSKPDPVLQPTSIDWTNSPLYDVIFNDFEEEIPVPPVLAEPTIVPSSKLPYPMPIYITSDPSPAIIFEPNQIPMELDELQDERDKRIQEIASTGYDHKLDSTLPAWMTSFPESGEDESVSIDDFHEIEEILSSTHVEEHVNQLQAQILPHLGGNPYEIVEAILPSDILSIDGELLDSIDDELTAREFIDISHIVEINAVSQVESEEKTAEFHEASQLFTDLEAADIELAPEEKFTGMRFDEVETAIQQLRQGQTGELGDLSEEDIAMLEAMDTTGFGFEPAPLFLAEAQADIDKITKLAQNFGVQSYTDGAASQLNQISAMLRKVAEMMGLAKIADQITIIEEISGAVENNNLPASFEVGEMLRSAVADLDFLLEPHQNAASALTLSPIPQNDEEIVAFEAEAVVANPQLKSEITSQHLAHFGNERSTTKAMPLSGVEVDTALAEVFAGEAREHIHNLDLYLGRLEKEPTNREIIREIRRTAHTLKGSAAMVGFTVISQTSHLMEDLLDRLYEGLMEVNKGTIELLFVTFNYIDNTARGLERGSPENPATLNELRSRYAAIICEEEEEESKGGAFIFKEAQAQAAELDIPTLHAVREEEIAALEVEQNVQQGETTQFPVSSPLDVEIEVRVPIKRLNEMLNQVGELVINRTVLEQNSQAYNRVVEELSLALRRLQRLTRELETRYEVELLKNSGVPNGSATAIPQFSSFGNRFTPDSYDGEFDELEMDRYTEFHQVSREMTETVSDLSTMQRDLETLRNDLENLTMQQGRITDDLQDKLVKIRLVPLSTLTPRLYRTARTVAAREGKEVQFLVSGDNTMVDKTIFEEIGDPLLHLIRNALDHGIEMPEVREAVDKPRQGTVTFTARTEGSQVVIEIRDDGAGIDTELFLLRGIEKGLIRANSNPTLSEIYNLMFLPGFSTSATISEISGRGIGLDVVQANVAALKGIIEVESELGVGTVFTIRLPSTLTITRAILVKSGGYTYAIPVGIIERTTRIDAGTIEFMANRPYFHPENENSSLPLINLRDLLRLPNRLRNHNFDEDSNTPRTDRPLLILAGLDRYALEVDELVRQQEVVIKDLGTHLKTIQGILGSTILGNGQVVLILNIFELLVMAGLRGGSYVSSFVSVPKAKPQERAIAAREMRRGTTGRLLLPGVQPQTVFRQKRSPMIQIVDDSLSVRKVLSGMLEKSGFRVRTSKDGQEALEALQQLAAPDLIIMDIEMPRMDGYELTRLLKSSPLYRNIPVVMLTSRGGIKHRQKAEDMGADGFLVKPYQEEELLQMVSVLLTSAH